jgi:hypothetical protein
MENVTIYKFNNNLHLRVVPPHILDHSWSDLPSDFKNDPDNHIFLQQIYAQEFVDSKETIKEQQEDDQLTALAMLARTYRVNDPILGGFNPRSYVESEIRGRYDLEVIEEVLDVDFDNNDEFHKWLNGK